MIPNPIGKVLSIFRSHRVRALLMGGQACILYGAAEFSRDVDLAVLASESNLAHVRNALAALRADPVFVPAMNQEVLLRGHACHFRTHVPEADGLWIDLMTVLRGCAPFAELWMRRRRFSIPGVGPIAVLALPDLVQAKKTQRDKDWPMIRRLVEVDYHLRTRRPPRSQVDFWLREARSAELLIELARRYPGSARKLADKRAAVRMAIDANSTAVERAIRAEEESIRVADRAYWQPLREELFRWRRGRIGQ